MTSQIEQDYVLGTDDAEIERLALQHRVWRPRALDAWRRAGFSMGQTLLDVGCGPGHASLDLADVVGPTGRVVALERSRRFLDHLGGVCGQRGVETIEPLEVDLDETFPQDMNADGAWCRWVFSFLKSPQAALARIAPAIRPGGVFVLHEYFDYSTWRLAPPSPELDEFVAAVMKSWRDEGGEPNIGLDLPRWLGELGFEIRSLRPIVDVVAPSNFVWNWPKTFIQAGAERLVGLGYLTAEEASSIVATLAKRESEPHTFMVTPAVLEIIAVRT